MKRYIVIWNTEDCCDSTRIEFTTLEAAKNEAKDVYYEWMSNKQDNWSVIFSEDKDGYIPAPTKDQIEEWDNMIDNCYAYIRELDKNGNIIDKENYYKFWLSDDELKEIGWMEWSELKERNNW